MQRFWFFRKNENHFLIIPFFRRAKQYFQVGSEGLSQNSPWLLVTSPECSNSTEETPRVPAPGSQPQGHSLGVPAPLPVTSSGGRGTLGTAEPCSPSPLLCPHSRELPRHSRALPRSSSIWNLLRAEINGSWAGFGPQLCTLGLLHRKKAPHGPLSWQTPSSSLPGSHGAGSAQPSLVTGGTAQEKHPKPTQITQTIPAGPGKRHRPSSPPLPTRRFPGVDISARSGGATFSGRVWRGSLRPSSPSAPGFSGAGSSGRAG